MVLANAPRMDYERSIVYFDPRRERADAAARKLAGILSAADVSPLTGRRLRRLSNRAMVVVVLGRNFSGQLAPPPGSRRPAREAPAVARNPALTLPYLRSLRSRVPFTLAYPTLIERSSTLDTPVRAYDLAGRHKAVRLVFETGADEYWGIQMTNWHDAPIIAEPNREVTIKGRRYGLYYAGRDLRMVVRWNGNTSYWVVNTLLNTPSTETMPAIAKGLRPLPRR